MLRVFLTALVGLAAVFALACSGGDDEPPAVTATPPAEGTTGAGNDGSGEETTRLGHITFADGLVCRHAAKGAPPEYDGDEDITFACEDREGAPRVILGLPSFDEDRVTVELATLTGSGGSATLEDREMIEAYVSQVRLGGDDVCFNAGGGAVHTIDNERLAFVCGAAPPEEVLLADFAFEGDRLLVTHATLGRAPRGYQLAESAPVSVRALHLVVPSDAPPPDTAATPAAGGGT